MINTLPTISPRMITIDRSITGQSNFIDTTLTNLRRSSPDLAVNIFDNTPAADVLPAALHIAKDHPPNTYVRTLTPTANENVAWALTSPGVLSDIGEPPLHQEADYLLFLEDDLDFCANFELTIRRWLRDHASHNAPNLTGTHLVYSFGANYPQASSTHHSAWDYPITDFYGTQCFAIRSDDARSLAAYLREDPYRHSSKGIGWDIIMAKWAAEQGHTYFLASAPSFVQHIGMTSVVEPREGIHTFPSWPGREWEYVQPAESNERVMNMETV